MLLSLTDGTTTLTLSGSGSYHGVTYFPMALSLREASSPGSRVTEQIELIVRGASAATTSAAIAAIEKMLMAARRRQADPMAPRVYVNYQAYTGATTGRSEIFDGDVALDTNPEARQVSGDAVRVWVTIERAAFWEGSLTQLVTNKTITNADGSNSYYTATAVAGVLPTPCKITLTNSSGSTQSVADVYMGCNAFNVPATFDGTFGAKSLTITAPRTMETAYIATWTPTASELDALGASYWRFVAAFTGGCTADVYYRLQWVYGGVTVVGKTKESYAASAQYTLDLGAMALPNIGDPGLAGITLQLKAASATASGTPALTLLQALPADNYRWLDLIGVLANGEVIVDDGCEGFAYVDGGSARYPQVFGSGAPLMVFPAASGHRFSTVVKSSTYDTALAQVLNVWYRPRYLTVI